MKNKKMVEQRVVVITEDGARLTYEWEGERKLRRGDYVMVPATYWQNRDHLARVVSLAPEYNGDCRPILCVMNIPLPKESA